MKQILLLASAAMILGLSSCQLFKQPTVTETNGEVNTKTLQQTKLAITEVIKGEWKTTNIEGMEVEGIERPYITFEPTAANPYLVKFYANNGCNILNGDFAITPGGEMRPSDNIASTMRLCPDAKYELSFTTALNLIRRYSLEKQGNDYVLHLKDSTGKDLMTLRRTDTAYLDGAWKVTGITGIELPADYDAQLVIDVPELRLHGNTGCNVLNGDIAIDPDTPNSIAFGNVATTRMACPHMEIEAALLSALDRVDRAIPTGTDRLNLVDAQGNTLINLQRLAMK